MTSSRALLALLALPACAADPPLPGEPQPYDVLAYDLRGEYDWDRARLVAAVDITFTTAPDLTSIVLDSAVEVASVVDPDGRDLPFTADPEQQTLTVDITSLADHDPLRVTVAYEAPAGESLRAWNHRAGDPVTSRAVYTFSEPEDARRWLPSHDRPDDRATFSVELRVPADESLIANGTLELDEPDGAARRMRWATDDPLPTYLMAFAVGPQARVEGRHGDLPIAVVHRPGLDGELADALAELDRMLSVFEPLLGPYPFSKYDLVLLPAFGGGIEHADITFQGENSSNFPAQAGDLDLTAHELAHQWWGDHVTVATWDDVWIKEGFATLLAAEPARIREDRSNAGTLFGDSHEAYADDAVRDPALAPDDKYTSGPYGRAAWLLTQIRGLVGEAAFFATVRDLLVQHADGVIATDDLLAAFAPDLGDAALARVRNAIDAPGLPRVTVRPGKSGGAVLTLADPDASLVAPFELEWRRADGTREPLTLVPDVPLTLEKHDPGDHLVIDPRDVHIRLNYLMTDDASFDSYYADLVPLTLPAGADALAALAALPGVHQRFVVGYAGLPPIAPEQLPDLLASLHSDAARALAVRAACIAALADPDQQAAWTAVLTAVFTDDPPRAATSYVSTYSECGLLLDVEALFADDWDALAAGLTTPTVPYARLALLSLFDLPPDRAYDVWAPVVRSAHGLRLRSVAAGKILDVVYSLDREDTAALAPWRALVLELLTTHETSEVLSATLYTALAFAEPDDILDAIVDLLHNPRTWTVHGRAVCTAVALLPDRAAVDAFAARLTDAPLSTTAAERLADPDQC